MPHLQIAIAKYVLTIKKRGVCLMASRLPKTRNEVIERAKEWFDRDALFLDTETTGLSKYDEIIEICIVDCNGNFLFNSLIKPTMRIPYESIVIHGIRDIDVKKAPRWPDVYDRVRGIIENRLIIAYNASFDYRMLNQTNDKYNLEHIPGTWACAMKTYAVFRGSANKWHKLEVAADQMGLTYKEQLHRSHADCMLTLDLAKAMAYAIPDKVAVGNELTTTPKARKESTTKTITKPITDRTEVVKVHSIQELLEIIKPDEITTSTNLGCLLFITIPLCFVAFPFGLVLGLAITTVRLYQINKEKNAPSYQQAKMFNNGLIETRKGLWSSAINRFNTLLNLNNEHKKAHILLAYIYYNAYNNYEKALIQIENLVEDDSITGFNHIALAAVCYYKLNRYEEAATLLDQLPDSDKFNYMKGLYFFKAKQYEKALKCLHAVLNIDPNNDDVRIMVGRSFYEQGYYDSALEVLKVGPSRRRNPDKNMLEAKYWLGKTYLVLGDTKKANNQFNKIYSIDNNYMDVREYVTNHISSTV